MYSKTFGYALRAVVYVAINGQEGKKVGLLEISKELEIPHHFLGKVMQDMVRHRLIDSIKGPSGGFFANENTLETPLIEILKITDGVGVMDVCALGIRRCNAKYPCPLHDDFGACRNNMLKVLAAKTVSTLAAEVESGQSFLVR